MNTLNNYGDNYLNIDNMRSTHVVTSKTNKLIPRHIIMTGFTKSEVIRDRINFVNKSISEAGEIDKQVNYEGIMIYESNSDTGLEDISRTIRFSSKISSVPWIVVLPFTLRSISLITRTARIISLLWKFFTKDFKTATDASIAIAALIPELLTAIAPNLYNPPGLRTTSVKIGVDVSLVNDPKEDHAVLTITPEVTVTQS